MKKKLRTQLTVTNLFTLTSHCELVDEIRNLLDNKRSNKTFNSKPSVKNSFWCSVNKDNPYGKWAYDKQWNHYTFYPNVVLVNEVIWLASFISLSACVIWIPRDGEFTKRLKRERDGFSTSASWDLHIKQATNETLLHNLEMYWSLFGVWQLGQVKLVNCNQILCHIADENRRVKFHMT